MRKTYFLLLVLALCPGVVKAQQNALLDGVISDFESLGLAPESYWDGSDLSGGFISGLAFFPNNYNPDWFAWNQWAYSSMANDSTPGFMNQFSAVTAAGYDPAGSGGSTYAVSYVVSDFVTNELIPVPLYFADSNSHVVEGFYVTNGTYPYLSMMHGDEYTKKFGGESGDDPDYFKLLIWGMISGTATDTVEFFLADYRFSNNDEDYIVDEWTWIDLEDLGEVDSLMFSMKSTDVGMFGINTPTFFCMDNLSILPDDAGIVDFPYAELSIGVYPNPSNGLIHVEAGVRDLCRISVSDLCGNLVYLNERFPDQGDIDLQGLSAGCYILRLEAAGAIGTRKIIIR
ncbi:MAG: DUF4465 domain-containing protein [Bacteroidales bacterium]|jgi:hypothetical protein|nr:DUF4465 domain-containing protein [Bacteroidales bacterium]